MVTDSRNVAAVFGKQHAHVLRDIRYLECSSEFRLSNFGESSYQNEQCRGTPCYEMTRDGFTFLVKGYTGIKAAHFFEKYIETFNAMEAELRARRQLRWPARN